MGKTPYADLEIEVIEFKEDDVIATSCTPHVSCEEETTPVNPFG